MQWDGNPLCLVLALALALEIRATWRNFRYLIFFLKIQYQTGFYKTTTTTTGWWAAKCLFTWRFNGMVFVITICILEISNFGFRRKELCKIQTFKVTENFNIYQIWRIRFIPKTLLYQLSNRTQWYIGCNTTTPEMPRVKWVAFQVEWCYKPIYHCCLIWQWFDHILIIYK